MFQVILRETSKQWIRKNCRELDLKELHNFIGLCIFRHRCSLLPYTNTNVGIDCADERVELLTQSTATGDGTSQFVAISSICLDIMLLFFTPQFLKLK